MGIFKNRENRAKAAHYAEALSMSRRYLAEATVKRDKERGNLAVIQAEAALAPYERQRVVDLFEAAGGMDREILADLDTIDQNNAQRLRLQRNIVVIFEKRVADLVADIARYETELAKLSD